MQYYKKLLVFILFQYCVLVSGSVFAQSEVQGPPPFWKIKGNIGTTAPSVAIGTTVNNNFLGTTDAVDFAIATSGFERLRVLANGNIGVRNKLPIQELDINGRLAVQNGIIQRGTTAITTTSDLGLYSQISGNWIRIATNAAPIKFFTDQGGGNSAGTNFLMTIETNGNVGIGTNVSPDDKLDVVGNAQVSGYLRAGNPTTASNLKKGKKTFTKGADENFNCGSGTTCTWDRAFTYDLGQLNIPTGATNFTVRAITIQHSGLRYDNDEDVCIQTLIGGNTSGWCNGSSYTIFGGDNVWQDWNWVGEHAWTFTTNQTVQFRILEERETCFLCNNDLYTLSNIETTVFYDYNQALQAGDISAEGRIYANGQYESGDLAEHFKVIDNNYETGDIVTLSFENENEYKLATEPYDQYMLGVISENPSVVLNKASVGPAVGLTGRVKLNIVNGEDLIKKGDHLTSSPIAGKAMKARDGGYVIGYAVEDQKSGENFVTILLQPGKVYIPKNKDKKGRYSNN